MTENPELLATVLGAPDDDAPRLVYADWLDDTGESARAEFIRVQVELAAKWEAKGSTFGSAGGGKRVGSLHSRQRELLLAHWPSWLPGCLEGLGVHQGNYDTKLHEHAAPAVWWHRGFIHKVRLKLTDWVGRVCPRCPGEGCSPHGLATNGPCQNESPIGPDLVALCPLDEVLLTDRRPYHYINPDRWSWLGNDRLTAHESYLPRSLFDRLEGGLFTGSEPLRHYDSPGDAVKALSGACIRWAKGVRQ